ncbi:helix-turn-helix domain-containing protein [Labrys monachus]|uniref:AraC-like DNA-binding protein n=1 Tax=Labrys monachus TaxID=217067 RepID=A0ABU0F8Y4_9HYPH|nr:helix-turn-helix domain-containing protein [Labrys monachus]MDQ0391011.1 AraC-like DNA-binding protein [Labrys monachus]
MQNPGIHTRLATHRQIHIGRLVLDVALADPLFPCGRDRVKNVGDAAYILLIPLSEKLNYAQGGRAGTIKAGEYVLLSQMEFYEFSSQPGALLLMLRIPAVELRGRLTSVDDHIGRRFGANEQMTRLLVDLLRNVAEVFAESPPPNPEALATEIFSFIALAIGSEDRGSTVDVRNARYHLRRRIFDFIEKNLGDQDLTPRRIAASSRISLSYLYSLFNDDNTTVSQFMQVKRLQRAYELLVADPKGRLTIAEIAYQVGFKNVSHFSRSFSRHFGTAPRDARRIAATPADIRPAGGGALPERTGGHRFEAGTLEAVR